MTIVIVNHSRKFPKIPYVLHKSVKWYDPQIKHPWVKQMRDEHTKRIIFLWNSQGQLRLWQSVSSDCFRVTFCRLCRDEEDPSCANSTGRYSPKTWFEIHLGVDERSMLKLFQRDLISVGFHQWLRFVENLDPVQCGQEDLCAEPWHCEVLSGSKILGLATQSSDGPGTADVGHFLA